MEAAGGRAPDSAGTRITFLLLALQSASSHDPHLAAGIEQMWQRGAYFFWGEIFKLAQQTKTRTTT